MRRAVRPGSGRCLATALLAACSAAQSSGTSPVEAYSTGIAGQAATTSTRTLDGTVVAVDTASRRLTVRGEDGHAETIEVPPDVKRLRDLSVGDIVHVEVQEGILFEYQPHGSRITPSTAVVAAGRAGPGEPPGTAAASGIQSTVIITAVDLTTRLVEFQDTDGFRYHVKAGPKLPIEKLVVGDRMLATYVATVAIAVEKD